MVRILYLDLMFFVGINVGQTKSKVKTMLIVFFDFKGIIHHEFVPEGQTVNKEYYKEVLQRLRLKIRRKRTELWETGNWFLLHDNARPHKALKITQFLAKNVITEVPHAPYSPDLSPCDYFLFPKIKRTLKGRFFDSIEDIQKKVTEELNKVSKNEFSDCFLSLEKRWKKCIDSEGMYFEGDHV